MEWNVLFVAYSTDVTFCNQTIHVFCRNSGSTWRVNILHFNSISFNINEEFLKYAGCLKMNQLLPFLTLNWMCDENISSSSSKPYCSGKMLQKQIFKEPRNWFFLPTSVKINTSKLNRVVFCIAGRLSNSSEGNSSTTFCEKELQHFSTGNPAWTS